MNNHAEKLFQKVKRILLDHEIMIFKDGEKFRVYDKNPFGGSKSGSFFSLCAVVDHYRPILKDDRFDGMYTGITSTQ